MSQQPPPNFNFDTSGGKDNSASKQPEPQSGAKKLLSSLSATAGAAAKLVVLQTERTKLTTMTLPAAYRALGKDCVQQKRHLESVPELMQQLRSVMGDLKALSEAATAQPAAQSLTDKAKAAGKQATDLARQKQLGMKRDALIADIGKAIHDQQGDASGQTELVAPIRDALTRLFEVDADISRLSEIGKGSFLTPKRLLIGGGIAAVLLVGVMVMMAGSSLLGGKNGGSGGSNSSSKDYLAGIDFTKGPNGEAVSKHEQADRMIEGFKKKNSIIPHGLTVKYWDQTKTVKSSEGYYVVGKEQGTHRAFNRDGKLLVERTYDNGTPRGVHKGTLLDGKGEWSITYADNGLVDLTNTPCGGFLSQFIFVCRATGRRFLNVAPGNDEFGYLWMARLEGANNQFTTERLESWFGTPTKLPGSKSSEERWQYRCKDGVVELRVSVYQYVDRVDFTKRPDGEPVYKHEIHILGPDLYSTTQLP